MSQSHTVYKPTISEAAGLVYLSRCHSLTLIRWVIRGEAFSVGEFEDAHSIQHNVCLTRDGCFIQR